ncbi:MAG: DUF5654 family protein [Candidatus Pacebacteria bacterium]|nr:DUF5654 family protein [Candidatus Paceibacterota bacterium]MCF7862738.1 DUF5654 family protein [Candidatus Paceibacterota bacterium]
MKDLIPAKKEDISRFKSVLSEQAKGYVLGGLGVVAGLAWNEAIKSLIDMLFNFSRDSVWAKFIYAVMITVVVIIVGKYIFRASKDDKK